MKRLLQNLNILLIIFAVTVSVYSRQKSEAKMIDSFGYTNSEDASARIDNFLLVLNSSPSDLGVIVVYGGKLVKKGEVDAHIRGIRQALRLKNVNLAKIKFIVGGYREKLNIEFWTAPPGAENPKLSPTINAKKVRIKGISGKIIPYQCCL